jgi:hypothetical protein
MAVLRRHGLMTARLARHYYWLMARAVVAQAVKSVLPRGILRAILRRRPIKGLG